LACPNPINRTAYLPRIFSMSLVGPFDARNSLPIAVEVALDRAWAILTLKLESPLPRKRASLQSKQIKENA